MSVVKRASGLAVAVALTLITFGTAVQAKTIVDVAQGAGQFKTLLAAAKAAGIAGALAAPGAKTVFAPTDAAFAKLPKGTVETLLKPENRGKLKAILTYHVVAGRTILAKDIPAGRTHVTTLNGKALQVRKHGGVRVNGARVSTADVRASNGVIHVIDRVLIPR